MRFLTIREGDDVESATVVLGSTDDAVIAGVIELLAKRLGVAAPRRVVEIRRERTPAPAREEPE